MPDLKLSDWIAIIQSAILLITIIIIIVQYRQASKHHADDLKNILRAFRSQIHERILSNLLDLNRIMLEFPNDIKKAFKGFANSSVEDVRCHCYVYALLDQLNYLVLHEDVVDPYVEKHLRNLASLLYTEPRMRKIFDEVKDQQSEALVTYLENKVKPATFTQDE